MNNRNGLTCPEREIIMGYLEESLPEFQMSVIEKHLMQCDKCIMEAASLSRMTVLMTDGENMPVPDTLQEAIISSYRNRKVLKHATEFVIALSEKAVSLIKTAFSPPECNLSIYNGQLPAHAFRGSAERDSLTINQKIDDIDLNIQFLAAEGPAATLQVTFHKLNAPLSKERVSLYKKDQLLFSKVTSADGIVLFPDITYGFYRIAVPSGDIEMSFKILPPEEDQKKQ